MTSRRWLVLSLAVSIIVEYVLGGFVTFDDPSNAGFQLSSFSFSWPAVLPLVHRLFALFLLIFWIVGTIYLRNTAAHRVSHITAGLIVLQIIVGALIPATLSSHALNAYIIVAHFSIGGLIVIGAGLTAYLGWRS